MNFIQGLGHNPKFSKLKLTSTFIILKNDTSSIIKSCKSCKF